ncbi:hypothetical protein QE109_13590 [Fusibacter bizertensis]|jgi:hypothetical protein|uniref:Resolvase HTH domain-containing protein n=1 Tax=Fusibacter bizertensis TaxID=1488331 RepID=A0ABT6NFM6_9FIRM|nr:hypothetical protein [Fusibacter bizertensis]MDH8679187.1 hypothetical protein [Fusibacter bizertensis]
MYRVIEVARMLGVSKVTIYKKVNKNKKILKNHIHTRSNITYIDDVGVDIIKDTIEINSSNIYSGSNDVDELKKEYLDDMSETIDFLSSQIQIKKKQIQKKDEIIEAYKSILKSNRGKLQYLDSKINQVN